MFSEFCTKMFKIDLSFTDIFDEKIKRISFMDYNGVFDVLDWLIKEGSA